MVGVPELQKDLPVNGNRKVLVPDDRQSVVKIIHAIRINHDQEKPYFDKVCNKFWQGDAEKTARLLFDFCKKHVFYVIEPEKDQTVKTPGRLLKDGHGDCKHYASFICGICDALNRAGKPIEGYYRFVSDIPDNEVHHVFAVVKGNGKEYWVDPVVSSFNKRPTFYNTKDYRMAISKLSGTMDGTIHDRNIPIVGRMRNPFRDRAHLEKFLRKHGKTAAMFASPLDMKVFLAEKLKDQVNKNRQNGKPVMHGIDYMAGTLEIAGTEEVSGLDDIGRKKKAPGTKKRGFLKKIAEGVKKGAQKVKNLTLKVSLAAARGPLLALVALDAFRLARRYRDTVMGPNRNKFLDKWKSLGGDPKKMINAINAGWRFYVKHNRKGKPWNPALDTVRGSYVGAFPEDFAVISGFNEEGDPVVSGYGDNTVGVVQVAALIALATGLIAALRPFVKSKTPESNQAMADAAKEGVADIAASAGQAEQQSPLELITKGVTSLTKSGGGQMQYQTGETTDGAPALKIDSYQHPALNTAGQPTGVSDDDVEGGGETSVSKSDTGGGMMYYFNKGKEWVMNNKGLAIGGALLVFAGPPVYKAITKKRRR